MIVSWLDVSIVLALGRCHGTRFCVHSTRPVVGVRPAGGVYPDKSSGGKPAVRCLPLPGGRIDDGSHTEMAGHVSENEQLYPLESSPQVGTLSGPAFEAILRAVEQGGTLHRSGLSAMIRAPRARAVNAQRYQTQERGQRQDLPAGESAARGPDGQR